MIRCPSCGESLGSLAIRACPKCGRAFQPNEPKSFDTRPRAQRSAIRIVTGVAISVLSLATMVAAASMAPGLKFSSHEAAILAHVALGAACALVTAIAAACNPSWIARAILLLGGVLSMWSSFVLGIDQGRRVWQSQPAAPDEAFADSHASLPAIVLGWIPSAVWWLAIFGGALIVVRLLRRRSSARRAAEGAAG